MNANDWVKISPGDSSTSCGYIRKDTITRIFCKNTYSNCYEYTVSSNGVEYNISKDAYARLMEEIDPNWTSSKFYRANCVFTSFPMIKNGEII